MSEFEIMIEELSNNLNEMVEAIKENKLVMLMINGEEEDYEFR